MYKSKITTVKTTLIASLSLISVICFGNSDQSTIVMNENIRITSYSASPIKDVPAFPGAEGAGRYTTGGRGGKVLFVSRLDDDEKEGSLRWAINQDYPRIIVFRTSGIIELKSRLEIKNDNITIAGQSAPGDGVCIAGNSVMVKANNVIIRFMRFRMGDKFGVEDDALWGKKRENIIIDHCSMSWSTDECSSFYDNKNFTMQWCIISESLNSSTHVKGAHGYGGIWGGQKASFHHNLIAHHSSRNPRFCGSRYTGEPEHEAVDFRNNVIYNWGSNSGYAAEGGNYNIINNYYKPGPATNRNVRARIFEPYEKDGVWGRFFVNGNIMDESETVTSDNWTGINPHKDRISKDDIRSDKEFDICESYTHTASEAYEKVLAYGGASFRRDDVDIRIAEEVKTGTVTYYGSKSNKAGIIDSPEDVGGWPEYDTYDILRDSDGDGIPDIWEEANGLNKNNPDDAIDTSLDPEGNYMNVEIYLNSIVDYIIKRKK